MDQNDHPPCRVSYPLGETIFGDFFGESEVADLEVIEAGSEPANGPKELR